VVQQSTPHFTSHREVKGLAAAAAAAAAAERLIGCLQQWLQHDVPVAAARSSKAVDL
jgi:hypothetical protein